jgi:hypothetical protein
MPIFLLFLLNLLIFSCSFWTLESEQMSRNQKKSGHYKLYSYPSEKDFELEIKRIRKQQFHYHSLKRQQNEDEGNSSNNQDLVTLTIASLSPSQVLGDAQQNILTDKRNNQKYFLNVGGSDLVKKYVDVLKNKTERLLFLSTGGGWPKEVKHYPQFLYHFPLLKVHSAGFSANDFKGYFSNPFELTNQLKKISTPIIISNMQILSPQALVKDMPFQKFQIHTIKDIKVGIISLVSPQKIALNHESFFQGVVFEKPATTILKLAPILRQKGAQVIVVMMDQALDCTSELSRKFKIHPQKVNFDVYDNNEACRSTKESNHEIYDTLKKLPPNFVDLIITSSSEIKTKANNIIGNTPVLGAFDENHLALAQIRYSLKKHQVLSHETLLLQPVKICQHHFVASEDCFLDEPPSYFETKPAFFMSEKIE